MKARNLRCVVIDDAVSRLDAMTGIPTLGTDHLDVVALADTDGEKTTRTLYSWMQLMHLWWDAAFPEHDADLVLIDTNWKSDPDLDVSAKEEPDARGLLFGAIYVARLLGKEQLRPVGFAPYSQDSSGAAEDGYARTFIGLLLAMADHGAEEGTLRNVPSEEVVGVCARELNTAKGGAPHNAWGRALEMYRARFLAANEHAFYVVDQDSWRRAFEAVSTGPFERLEKKSSLRWYRADGTRDEVRLVSLFADKLDGGRWRERANEAARGWLEDICNVLEAYDTIVEWAVGRCGRDEKGEASTPIGLAPLCHALVLVLRWLEVRLIPESAPVEWRSDINEHTRESVLKKLLEDLGLEQTQTDRYFKKLFGVSSGDAIGRLDEQLALGQWGLPGMWFLRRLLEEAWQGRARAYDSAPDFPFPEARIEEVPGGAGGQLPRGALRSR